MYTQKCHKETPHTVILNKQKCHIFFSFREGRTGPVWGDWYQWEEGGGEERVWEDEYGANIVYTCV
jgi:hypothetical protein